jgi:glycerate dehydrogenase
VKIVVLDGYTLNPGDLSWAKLEALGECVVYERTPPEKVLERSEGAEILITNKTVLSRETIFALPDLKYIGVLATGYNIVDVQAACEQNIPVTNVPTYGTQSVAQLVFSHILNLAHNVGVHARQVSNGAWSTSADFCFWEMPLVEIAGKTLGLVGFGRIGAATAKIAHAFGMQVIAHDVNPENISPDVETVSLDDIFSQSDVISLHCPLTSENEKLVNPTKLALMKSTAFLINTSRGPLVDENALAIALNAGVIAGAGLDVLSVEPAQKDNPLATAKNCFITPHIAWATKEARDRLMQTAVENVGGFLNGHPQNVVN